MANTYLSWTPSANPTGNAKTFTFSAWLKFSKESPGMIMVAGSSDNSYCLFGSYSNGKFTLLTYTGYVINFQTPRVFRDLNCWYHVVLACDTTQASATDGVKLYVNNELQTFSLGSVSGETGYTQNTSLRFGTNGELITIGRNGHADQHYFDGIMSYVAFVDGQQLTPSTFGETDTTTGEWKIKTTITPGGTGWGTNGFFILKDGNSVTDQSGNGNNFTVAQGTLTKTEDNPSNVFATGNRLNVNAGAVGTFSNGNNTIKVANSSGSQFGSSSTLGMTTGKFYCEVKIITVDSTMIGVSPSPAEDARNSRSPAGAGNTGAVGCLAGSGNKYIADNGTTYGAATSAGGIMMIALDLDNLKVYFGSGGQWSDGSGAWNQSGLISNAAISLNAVASTPEGAYFFCFGDGGGSEKGKVAWNFGNGYFETTAVSSAGTNASGNGIFEYDVPTGYTALSTKGLNL